MALEKNKVSYTDFVFQIFTAVASLKECYKRNLRGRGPTVGLDRSKKKLPFSNRILNEIHSAVDHYYGKLIKLRREFEAEKNLPITKPKSLINKCINDKLLGINKHLEKLRSGLGETIKEEDKLGFKFYGDFVRNISLFDELDLELENEAKERDEADKKASEKKSSIVDKSLQGNRVYFFFLILCLN